METLKHRAVIQMFSRHGLMLFFFTMIIALSSGSATAQDKNQIVRIANLRIDSVHLEKYRVALQEEIETSIRAEPGVLTLYAVEDKKHAGHITVFEIYANDAAYQAHVESPHFRKYKSTTKDMVKSLELIEANPIALGTKPKK
jgi:quinol monooxygenase YgiN